MLNDFSKAIDHLSLKQNREICFLVSFYRILKSGSVECHSPFFIIIYFYLLIWLCWVLVVACGIFSCSILTFSCSMWDIVPQPGVEERSPRQEYGVLATGPPGKSLTHPSLAPQIPEPSGSPQATQVVGLKVKHRTICQGSSHPQEKLPFLSLFDANCFSCCSQYFPR